jgi:hypothetical protein
LGFVYRFCLFVCLVCLVCLVFCLLLYSQGKKLKIHKGYRMEIVLAFIGNRMDFDYL